MTSLMICRQLKAIAVEDKLATLDFGDVETDKLIGDEKLKLELDEFFAGLGLSYAIKQNQKEISDIDKLNEMLGGNLIKLS